MVLEYIAMEGQLITPRCACATRGKAIVYVDIYTFTPRCTCARRGKAIVCVDIYIFYVKKR